jgi:hypothetical protein
LHTLLQEIIPAGQEDVPWELTACILTLARFCGQRSELEVAARGYSRDHRPDCKQVNIGLVVTPEGLPLGYEIFAGNTADVTTVEEMVELMEKKYGQAQRIWVMDRGMISEENIDFLRARQARYLVGTPKSQLKQLAAQLLDQENWAQVQGGVEAHILVCFLTLALWRTREMWMRGKGLGNCSRQLLKEIATVRSMDVVLPVRETQSHQTREVRLRVIARPDRLVAELLVRLGLDLPSVPKLVQNVAEKNA